MGREINKLRAQIVEENEEESKTSKYWPRVNHKQRKMINDKPTTPTIHTHTESDSTRRLMFSVGTVLAFAYITPSIYRRFEQY